MPVSSMFVKLVVVSACSLAAAASAASQSTSCRGDILLQSRSNVSKGSIIARRAPTTDCAQRLQHYAERNSACVVIRGDTALLVHVYYGRSPGWDLPGGMRDHGEAACETAERETCEETGFAVKAVEKLTGNVFLCEILGENVCTKPKHEGFLKKRWVSRNRIEGVKYRGGTWGDKKQILRNQLGTHANGNTRDQCGCIIGQQGWSSSRNGCYTGSVTSDNEAAQCTGQSPSGSQQDACGCAVGKEGWSTSRNRCHSDSVTSSAEVDQCKRTNHDASEHDACGCVLVKEGWSSRRNRCHRGSVTTADELTKCSRNASPGSGDKDACGCTVGQDGWSSWRKRCHANSGTDSTEAARCSAKLQ